MLDELNKKIEKSIGILHKASQFQTLLIGLSGGKDSLALCELVKMTGIKNVRYFFMYFLPDLRIEKELLLYPCERFNIDYDSIIQLYYTVFGKATITVAKSLKYNGFLPTNPITAFRCRIIPMPVLLTSPIFPVYPIHNINIYSATISKQYFCF